MKVFIFLITIISILISGCSFDEVSKKSNLACVNGHIYIYKVEGISLIEPVLDLDGKLIQCRKVNNKFEYDQTKINEHWGTLE